MDRYYLRDEILGYYGRHEREWGYSLGSSSMDPEEWGASNCSALIWWAAHRFSPGCDLDRLGYGYTDAFADAGTTVAEGGPWDAVPYDRMLPLDLLLVDNDASSAEWDHVELYFGRDCDSELWGAGSAPLPHRSGDVQSYVRYWKRWRVVRFGWGCDECAGRLVEDGFWGAETTRALQRAFGLEEDGVVSGQWASFVNSNRALQGGWECDQSASGSPTIAALQRCIGVEPDGVMGRKTVAVLQIEMGTPLDGSLDAGSACVREMQRRINAGSFPRAA